LDGQLTTTIIAVQRVAPIVLFRTHCRANQKTVLRETCHPRATKAKQTAVETSMFATAAIQLLWISRFQVCRLKDEKVLSPPQTPTARNCCNAVAIAVVPRRSARPDTSPIKADATIF